MTVVTPNPAADLGDRSHVLLHYLDTFRAGIRAKSEGLSETALRSSLLPSGWTPIELVTHLLYMERRWLVWGFLADPVPDPWGDDDADGRWHASADVDLPTLLDRLDEGGRRTRAIVEAADLEDLARVGGRFRSADDCPTLERILLHVLQEYARHLGHLDIVRELADGTVGE